MVKWLNRLRARWIAWRNGWCLKHNASSLTYCSSCRVQKVFTKKQIRETKRHLAIKRAYALLDTEDE